MTPRGKNRSPGASHTKGAQSRISLLTEINKRKGFQSHVVTIATRAISQCTIGMHEIPCDVLHAYASHPHGTHPRAQAAERGFSRFTVIRFPRPRCRGGRERERRTLTATARSDTRLPVTPLGERKERQNRVRVRIHFVRFFVRPFLHVAAFFLFGSGQVAIQIETQCTLTIPRRTCLSRFVIVRSDRN